MKHCICYSCVKKFGYNPGMTGIRTGPCENIHMDNQMIEVAEYIDGIGVKVESIPIEQYNRRLFNRQIEAFKRGYIEKMDTSQKLELIKFITQS